MAVHITLELTPAHLALLDTLVARYNAEHPVEIDGAGLLAPIAAVACADYLDMRRNKLREENIAIVLNAFDAATGDQQAAACAAVGLKLAATGRLESAVAVADPTPDPAPPVVVPGEP